jgi:hypothetical protein
MIELIEVKDVCKILKVSRPTLSSLSIPSIRVGKREKYLLSDIQDYINSNKISGRIKQLKAEQNIIEKKHIKEKIAQYKKKFSSEYSNKNL